MRCVDEIEETLAGRRRISRRRSGGHRDARRRRSSASSTPRWRSSPLRPTPTRCLRRSRRWRISCGEQLAGGGLRHRCGGRGPGTARTRARSMRVAALQVVLDASQEAVHAAGAAPRRAGARRRTRSGCSTRSIASSCCSARIFRFCRASVSALYAAEFDASLADQAALTTGDPWQDQRLADAARARARRRRPLLPRLRRARSAGRRGRLDDFKLVQFPHREGQVWAALPEAWLRAGRARLRSEADVPEELHDYLARCGRDAALQEHSSRGAESRARVARARRARRARRGQTHSRACVCDEWPEFVPDPFQTAAIGFHYDAPGARPPQSVLLALPPRLEPGRWTLRRCDRRDPRGLRSSEAARRAAARSGRRARRCCCPGNYLPQTYTDDLPSVQLLEMLQRDAQHSAGVQVSAQAAFTLGKI